MSGPRAAGVLLVAVMPLNQAALLELAKRLQVVDADDMVRLMVGSTLQVLAEAGGMSVISAGLHERVPERTVQRDGARPKTVSTTAGDLTVRIPRHVRGRSPSRRARRGNGSTWPLHLVLMKTYVRGGLGPQVDDLGATPGVASGISMSEVSASNA